MTDPNSQSNSHVEAAERTPVIIKKYANRRLYHTEKSTYVTLEDLCQMAKDGQDFVVTDAKSGDDLTRQVLTQIIVEQEAGGSPLLPTQFLRQLISFYGGDHGQQLLPGYLAYAMEHYNKNQEQLMSYFSGAMGAGSLGMPPLVALERMGRETMRGWENMWGQFFTHTAAWLNPLMPLSQNDNSKLQSMSAMQRNLNELNDQIKTLSALKRFGE